MSKKEKLIEGILNKFDVTSKRYVRNYLDKKLDTILADLYEIVAKDLRHSKNSDLYTINVFDYRERWGYIYTKNDVLRYANVETTKRPWANSILIDFLCIREIEGRTKTATGIRFRGITMDALLEYGNALNVAPKPQFSSQLTDEDEDTEFFDTPIDIESLRAYRDQLANDLKYNSHDYSQTKKEILIRHQGWCNNILLSLNKKDGIDVLPQRIRKNSSHLERLYLEGVNLQIAPREVRHAALGFHYEYDLKAGVYGIFGGLAKTIIKQETGIDTDFETIKKYIKNRTKIRESITKELWPHLNVKSKEFYGYLQRVKQALTAIGFGAKAATGGCWIDSKGQLKSTALMDIFKDKEIVNKFLNIKIVSELTKEFTTAGRFILDYQHHSNLFEKCGVVDSDTDAQKLAKIYQGFEQKIMGQFMYIVSDKFNSAEDLEVLLFVHDAVYYNKGFSWIDIHNRIQLDEIQDTSYIQFDKTVRGLPKQLIREEQHKEHIEQEEKKALNYQPQSCSLSGNPQTKKQVMTPFGLIDAELLHDYDPTNDGVYLHD